MVRLGNSHVQYLLSAILEVPFGKFGRTISLLLILGALLSLTTHSAFLVHRVRIVHISWS